MVLLKVVFTIAVALLALLFAPGLNPLSFIQTYPGKKINFIYYLPKGFYSLTWIILNYCGEARLELGLHFVELDLHFVDLLSERLI